MFVRQNQQQFRNSNADVQIFYGDGEQVSATTYRQTWNKPPGVSHVYMMAIGGGAGGDGTTGGGSGAVTVWYGAAQNVPDNLIVSVGIDSATRVGYRNTNNSIITLIQANSGNSISGGAATTAGVFAASGFYQSIAGQNGESISQGASGTTFLSGGAGGGGGVVANYGYNNAADNRGYFLLQPIIVGVGGGANHATGRAAIGCGGGGAGGIGGPGMVLIASW
jgi:hypothetical protein